MRLGREAAEQGRTDEVILVNLSGRGDKDVATAARWFELVDADADLGAEGADA
jgi:tryptophan synthase beta chain